MSHLYHPLATFVAVAAMVMAPALVSLRPHRAVDFEGAEFRKN